MTLTDLLNSEDTEYKEYAEPEKVGYAGVYSNPKSGAFAFKTLEGEVTPFWNTE